MQNIHHIYTLDPEQAFADKTLLFLHNTLSLYTKIFTYEWLSQPSSHWVGQDAPLLWKGFDFC